MHYKTIIYEMLQNRPQLADELRQARKLLPTMELYSKELKASHEAWKEVLSQMRPDNQTQIASEALEIAVKELEDRLPKDCSENDGQAQVFDAAMLFRSHKPAK